MSPAFSAAWDREEGATFEVERKNIRKFEYGNMNVAGVVALDAGIELILELGVENIEERVLKLTGRLHDGLADAGARVSSPRDDAKRAGIVIVREPDPEKLFAFLGREKVRASLMAAGMLRFSPHFYNTEEEVDRVVELVGKFIRSE
jgi:selenocysteine lyase/cysteine desulfurase